MNEMLLEQNAQYRQNNRNQSTPATPIQQMPVTQHIPPQVSIKFILYSEIMTQGHRRSPVT